MKRLAFAAFLLASCARPVPDNQTRDACIDVNLWWCDKLSHGDTKDLRDCLHMRLPACFKE